jgi:hypothetical protein
MPCRIRLVIFPTAASPTEERDEAANLEQPVYLRRPVAGIIKPALHPILGATR